MADAFGGLSRAQLALTAAGRASVATQRAPLQQRPISSMSMDEIVAQLERAEATLAGPIRENLPDKGALLEQRVAELRAALEDRRNGMDADQPRGLRAHEQGEQRVDRMIEMPIAEASRIVAAQTEEVSRIRLEEAMRRLALSHSAGRASSMRARADDDGGDADDDDDQSDGAYSDDTDMDEHGLGHASRYDDVDDVHGSHRGDDADIFYIEEGRGGR